MNAERLLAHYEEIADAPDAIARLRRFILDLAVRGKLVPQDPSDEPASELLRRIAVARSQVVRSGRTASKALFPDTAEQPRELPEGWAAARLAELVTVFNGRAYKQNELLAAGTPVLRVGNLFTSDKWYYSDLRLDDDKYCDNGDLLYAWSASFGPFIWDGGRVIYHYHIWKLALHSEADLDKRYLYNFLLQKTREIKAAGHGISMTHMTKEKMERLLVPLPPLAEQQRIVAKVDELMALCDQLEAARAERETTRDRLTAASLARLNAPDPDTFADDARFALAALPALAARPDQFKALRQTILNLAVRGRLTRQPHSDELRGVAGSTTQKDNNLLPSGWACKTIAEIADQITDGEHSTPTRIAEQQVPLVTAKNVRDGYMDYGQTDWVSFSTAQKAWTRCRPQTGDLLLVCVGATTGRLTVLREPRDMVLVRSVAMIRPKQDISSAYLEIAIRSPSVQEQIWASVKAAAQPCLYLNRIKSLLIPLPPLAEQRRIVAKVDALMALCDRLEASLTEAAEARRRLLDALLAEALAPAGERGAAPVA